MAQYGIGSVTTTLIHLLCGDKRDGLILLDGEWGTGKTHFLNEKFKQTYDQKTIFTISVLGINSVEMFKSEIFNEYYLRLSDDIKEIPSAISSTVAFGTQTPEAEAPLSKMMAGIGNAIKKHVLSALDGLFIIDDIERIDHKLANDILGYCHSAYMKSDKIDFIIVSNTSGTQEFNIEHKEKIISNTVPFIPTQDDIYELFDEKLNVFNQDHISYLKYIIKKYNTVNIRIIEKIISGLHPLFKFHRDNPDKEIRANLELVISAYSALVILSRQYHYTFKKIMHDSPKQHADESEINSLLNAGKASGVPKEIKEYAFSITSERDAISALFFDKKKISIDEAVLSNTILTSEFSEKLVIEKLLETVHNKEKKPLRTWISAVNQYYKLTSGKYIKNDPEITNELIMNIADTYKKKDVLETLYIDEWRAADADEILQARNSGNVEKYLSTRHSYNKKPKIEHEIKENILQHGWHMFNTERLEKSGINSRQAPLKFIGVDLICDGIINKWKIVDIQSFRDYLAHLHHPSNMQNFLQEELTHLQNLHTNLNNYLANNSESFRYGEIFILVEVVGNIIERLRKQDSNI